VRKKSESNGTAKTARFAIAATFGLMCALHTQPAAAYCRTTSCPGVGTGAKCVPAQSTDCGIELFWKSPCVGFSMQQDASIQVSLNLSTQIFEEAFKLWENVDCGGGKHPRIKVVNLGPVECNAHEYNKKAGNANVILFQDESWPHVGAGSTLALTTVTYNVDTGEIYDADMELNSANIGFTTGDKFIKYDLLSIAAHETGHFLGLSHSADTNATMFSDYMPGAVGLRTLEPDDIAAICATYPPGDAIPSTCDPSPRRGFESECSPAPVPEDDGSCSTASGETRASNSLAALSLALACGLFTKRRRDRVRRS
jgi:hypothetical protein